MPLKISFYFAIALFVCYVAPLVNAATYSSDLSPTDAQSSLLAPTSLVGEVTAFGGGIAFNTATRKNTPFNFNLPTTQLSLYNDPAYYGPDGAIRDVPQNFDGPIEWTVSDVDHSLENVRNLNVDLHPMGATLAYSWQAFPFLLVPSSDGGKIQIGFVGNIGTLTFEQTGNAVLTRSSPTSGTFFLPGIFDFPQGGDLYIDVVDLVTPGYEFFNGALSGTYSLTSRGDFPPLISLDGTSSINIPMSLAGSTSTVIPDWRYTVSASADLVTTVTFTTRYHLEAVVPEPENTVTLGIALSALFILAVRLKRPRPANT